MTDEQKLAMTYLQDMQSTYVEGNGPEAHPLPEYYAIETALDTMYKYQTMQEKYKQRFKADVAAILTDIQLKIEEKYSGCDICEYFEDYDYEENDVSEYRTVGSIQDVSDMLQEKINELKGEDNGKDIN